MEWDSDLNITRIHELKVVVHPNILAVMRKLAEKVVGDEYGIYASGLWDGNEFVVGAYWYIPEQRVTPSTIDFTEDAPDGFNVVLHKHPTGIRRFSSRDWEYINPNFDASILYEGGDFVDACVRIPSPTGGFLLISSAVGVAVGDVEIPDEAVKRIIRAPVMAQYYLRNGHGTYKTVPAGSSWPERDGSADDPAAVREAVEEHLRTQRR